MSDQKQMVRLIGAQENLRKFARNWKHRVKWMYLNTETGQVRGDIKISMFKSVFVLITLCPVPNRLSKHFIGCNCLSCERHISFT